jgi:hypothetical protein
MTSPFANPFPTRKSGPIRSVAGASEKHNRSSNEVGTDSGNHREEKTSSASDTLRRPSEQRRGNSCDLSPSLIGTRGRIHCQEQKIGGLSKSPSKHARELRAKSARSSSREQERSTLTKPIISRRRSAVQRRSRNHSEEQMRRSIEKPVKKPGENPRTRRSKRGGPPEMSNGRTSVESGWGSAKGATATPAKGVDAPGKNKEFRTTAARSGDAPAKGRTGTAAKCERLAAKSKGVVISPSGRNRAGRATLGFPGTPATSSAGQGLRRGRQDCSPCPATSGNVVWAPPHRCIFRRGVGGHQSPSWAIHFSEQTSNMGL